MIVITTRTPNTISIEVVQGGQVKTVISDKEFNVIESEVITDNMIDLQNIKLITYVEVADAPPKEEFSGRKKRKHHNNNNQQEEPTPVVEEPPAEEVVEETHTEEVVEETPADDSTPTDDSETESK